MRLSNGETEGKREAVHRLLSTASVGPDPEALNCGTDCVPSSYSRLCTSAVCSALEPAWCPGPHRVGAKEYLLAA